MNYVKVKDREEIIGALARGYCYPDNERKTVDANLLIAQTKEIIKMLKKTGWVKHEKSKQWRVQLLYHQRRYLRYGRNFSAALSRVTWYRD